MHQLSTILYISNIIYPKYKAFWFVLYMYTKYYSVFKRKTKYKPETVSDQIIIRNLKLTYCDDVNNVVLVNESDIYKDDFVLWLYDTETGKSRKVFVVPCATCPKGTLFISNVLFHNFKVENNHSLRLLSTNDTKFAHEMEFSLISHPYDISNTVLDAVIENYFKSPKLVHSDDIIGIIVDDSVRTRFHTDSKINSLERIYLKCNKVTVDSKTTTEGHLCVIGQTAIKQTVNIQSYVPKILKDVDSCPYGLRRYFEDMQRALEPFFRKRKPMLKPVFLVQGEEGCGSDILLKSLSLKLGVHLYTVASIDLSANVYAQNESKLNNVFFTAKMSAPCILSIEKFQNFGRNNEGQYDQRLISNFENRLQDLFDNTYPVILVCCSTSKEISSNLKRLFLETFEIESPTDVERELTLKWLTEVNNLPCESVDFKDAANKTHGFYFEDLKALMYHAELHFRRSRSTRMTDDDFQAAIDFMQSNYNESLGAPKVPKVKWSDVGGLENVKNEIIRTINLPLKYPELLNKSGLTRSGVLLFGPPGTGKTLIAKAVATECSLCFLTVKGPELLNMYVGQSEQNVREVFERARQASPCIIFFDELDSLAPNRGISGDSGGVMDRVVSQLLAEMDGLDESGKVFIVGATNRPDLIDPALLRPGRFDKLLYVGPCTDLESKTAVLRALTRKFNLEKRLDLENIVKMCPDNITGADFYGLCSTAWSTAARRLIEDIQRDNSSHEDFTHQNVVVGFEDFALAIKNVKPSISKEDLAYFNNLNKELGSNYL